MKLRLTIFIIFLILIPNILLILLEAKAMIIILALSFSLCLIIYSASFIKKIFYPIELLKNGIETIKDGDYTVFLNKQSSAHELNQLIDIYNLMIEQLQRKRLELKGVQQFFEEIIQKLPFSVLIIDEFQHLKFANRFAEQSFRFSLSKFKNHKTDLIENADINTILNHKNDNEWLNIRGRNYKIKVSTFLINGLNHNVFSIEEMSRQLKSYQLETWKRIVRVISHEIQNSISPIISINQSIHEHIKSKEDFDDDYKEGLEYINQRLDRLSNFVSEYAKIAKLPDAKRKNTEIDHFFYNMIQLFKNNNIKISYSNLSSINYFFIDEKLFEQAIINIIKNSIDACSEVNNPLIKITIEKREDRPFLTLSDNGSGISADALENIFIPYYTTKEKGTGIGLTLVQEILNIHEFNYYIDSKINLGTSFIIEIK